MSFPSPTPGRFRGGASRTGFTLLELLATISVISVLAVMLLSAAGGVRNKAKSAQCLSNLNQIRIASQLYSQDNDNYTVPPHFNEALKPYVEVGQSNIAERPKNVWICPADRRVNKDSGIGPISYAYNPLLVGWPNDGYFEQSKAKLATINNPGKKIMIIDADAYWCCYATPTAAFRHSQAVNAIFFDGHVETLKFSDPAGLYDHSYWTD